MTAHALALQPAMVELPSHGWRVAVQRGSIHRDTWQEHLLPLLDQVALGLQHPVQRVTWRGVEVWRGDQAAPHGVYLFGDVGRGKSFLMQTLFDSVELTAKRRVHFHPFMEELHQRMHRARPPSQVDLMLFLASALSAEARLLCFDEFYITTLADGVLLGRLLEALFKCGVTVCATSNWAPDHLFQDGFNRNRVLPFIEVLKKHILVGELGHGVDWRRQPGERPPHYSDSPADRFLHGSGQPAQPATVTLRHAKVNALGADHGVFWFDFPTLCHSNLGRAEYMSLCHQARQVILSGVPRLSAEDADAAMRFVVLVDLLYEHRVALHIHSQVDLEEACTEGPAAFAWRRSVSRVHELARI